MINCIAIDDEPLALEIIESYISKIPSLNLLKSFSSPLDALEFLKTEKVDLLLLDIQMNDLTGIQFLGILKDKPLTILITAFDNYALKGFELDVVDYLLKPVSFDRFLVAIDKVNERLSSKSQPNKELHKEHHYLESSDSNFCFIKTEHKLQKVFYDDILYIEGMGDYLRIITKTQKVMTLSNFKKMEEILPEARFCRVHKSYIVALDKISNIEKNRILIGDFAIPISDKFKSNLFEKLEKVILQ